MFFVSSVASLIFLVFILFCSILFILVSKWFLRAAWYIYMLCMSQIFMSRCVGIFGPLWISACHRLVLFRISVQSRFSFVWVTVTFFLLWLSFFLYVHVCAFTYAYWGLLLCVFTFVLFLVIVLLAAFSLGFHTVHMIKNVHPIHVLWVYVYVCMCICLCVWDIVI